MDWAEAVYPACLPFRVAAVLDLPGVIERVPRNPARRVAGGHFFPAIGEPSDGARIASSMRFRRSATAARSRGSTSVPFRPSTRAYPPSAPTRCSTILSRSRPPPRGPLRSSAGAPATIRSKIVQAASTIAASCSPSFAVVRRPSALKRDVGDAELGRGVPVRLFGDVELPPTRRTGNRASPASRPPRSDQRRRRGQRRRPRGSCRPATSRATRARTRTPCSA